MTDDLADMHKLGDELVKLVAEFARTYTPVSAKDTQRVAELVFQVDELNKHLHRMRVPGE